MSWTRASLQSLNVVPGCLEVHLLNRTPFSDRRLANAAEHALGFGTALGVALVLAVGSPSFAADPPARPPVTDALYRMPAPVLDRLSPSERRALEAMTPDQTLRV